MTYHVTRNGDGRPRIDLRDEPPYCRALAAAPSSREAELGGGRWLVLAFAAWSMPDIRAIQTALDAAKRFGGGLTLGLRPFDVPEEFDAWCPGLEGLEETLVWLAFTDGELCLEHRGALTVDELVNMIEARSVA